MILLDTCLLLRIAAEQPLPPAVDAMLRATPWAISSLSAWEIAIKHALGKLPLPQPPTGWWPRAVEILHLTVVPFTAVQALRAGALPALHQDPFDRGIVATALIHDWPLATVDHALLPYAESCGLRVVS